MTDDERELLFSIARAVARRERDPYAPCDYRLVRLVEKLVPDHGPTAEERARAEREDTAEVQL